MGGLGSRAGRTLRVHPLQLYRLLLGELVSRLAQESIHEEPAAHADAPVYAPDRKLDAGYFQRLRHAEYVLIDGIHKGSIQIEKERQDFVWLSYRGTFRRGFLAMLLSR